jgi:hypothetical protein
MVKLFYIRVLGWLFWEACSIYGRIYKRIYKQRPADGWLSWQACKFRNYEEWLLVKIYRE